MGKLLEAALRQELTRRVRELGLAVRQARKVSEIVEEALASDAPRDHVERLGRGETIAAVRETKPAADETPPAAPAPSPALPAQAPIQVGQAALQLPLASEPAGRRFGHVNLHLDGVQGTALRRLFDGLVEQRATLANGRPIAAANDALRWLLEQVAAQ